MSLEYEKRLEAEIDRELKGLPELIAPESLLQRVTEALGQKRRLRWYQQSWQMWPIGVQAVSLVFLMAIFGTLCFGAWKLSQAEAFAAMMQRPMGWLTALGALGEAFNVVLGSLFIAVKQLGTGVLIACVAALALGYAMCVALGTVYFRLALSRR
jgi:hypothetical protein